MKTFLRDRLVFLIILISWVVVGAAQAQAAFAYITLCVLFFRQRGQYTQIFLGFLFILVLADSRNPALVQFAPVYKNIYIVLLTLIMIVDRKRFPPTNNLVKGFIPFLIVAVVALVKAPGDDLFIASQKTLSYVLLLIAGPNFLLKGYQQQGTEFFREIIFFGTLILLVGLGLYVVNPELVQLKSRYAGIFGNPNGLGIFCLLFWFLFAIIESRYKKLFTRWEVWAIYGVIAVSLLLTGSRSNIISLGIFLTFSRVFRLSNAVGFIALFVIIVGYEYLILNFNEVAISLGLSDFLRLETLESGSGRLVAWNFAWTNIQNDFFLGQGFAHTDILFEEYKDVLNALGHQGHAHNCYLTFWLNTGLIGLIAFFFWGFFPLFFKAARQSRLSMPILFGCLFSMNFESWLTASLNPFTIVLWIGLTILLDPYILGQYENDLASLRDREAQPEIGPKTAYSW